MDLSIIIVNWNTKALLHDCLRSLYSDIQHHSFEVIVVDNHSSDGSPDMVREDFPQVVLVANEDNRGFAAANNQALRRAKGDHLLLLNPDTKVIDGAIDRMLAFSQAHPTAGIITCKLFNGDGSLQKSVNTFYGFWKSFVENRFVIGLLQRFHMQKRFFMSYWDHQQTIEIDWAHGAVMLFSREVFDKVGLLDEQFYIYAEEMDYFLRVSKAGFQSWFVADAHIIHYGQSSSRQRRSAMFIQNYKSFYLFLKKHYGLASYRLYRTRAIFYMLLWYLNFSFVRSEEAGVQRKIYWETLRWHFTKDSAIA
ncbi:hypothetical protein SAMN05421823_104306 [Catalinimonas alkaloidigena]|uniref:Glycosyltransferase 2-like domain-containing protein n=1 Tax=Catalinimonas alkaloidigena TaxID=1075417 RepID=A0A1G9H3U7_9BACT|nr:glycosyltransferase family 2 protein [Catalinimonas alkaloidigena]SDL07464.1 hypothetical protein SAMN05421823_104306 [Catalinimonas alkaloidigena]